MGVFHNTACIVTTLRPSARTQTPIFGQPIGRRLYSHGTHQFFGQGPYHTHEDVDGFLSELLPSLRRHPFNSVADVLREDLAKEVER